MVRSGVLGLGLLVSAAFPCWGLDASKPTKDEIDKKARELVRRLGDPNFRQREAAAHELLALGSQSRVAIEAALNDGDVEIRERCRRLLPLALEADIKSKLRAFTEDTEGVRQHDLPGWKRWRSVVGFDAESRKFFAQMLRENIDLLQYLESDPQKTAGSYMTRCNDLYATLYNTNRVFIRNGIGVSGNGGEASTPNMHEFAALLFIGGDDKVMAASHNSGKVTYQNQLAPLLQQSYIKNYLGSSSDGPVFRKIFFDWLDQLTNSAAKSNVMSAQSISYALGAIQQNDLKEATGFVEKVIAMKEMAPHTRSSAITTLGRIGDASHVKILQPYLSDATVIGSINFGGVNAKPSTSQLRDVALGVMIHLLGQKPGEFEFDGMKRNNWGNSPTFYYYMFGFEDDANRRKSYEKWNEYAKKNGKPMIEVSALKDEPKAEQPKNPAPAKAAAPVPAVLKAAVVPNAAVVPKEDAKKN